MQPEFMANLDRFLEASKGLRAVQAIVAADGNVMVFVAGDLNRKEVVRCLFATMTLTNIDPYKLAMEAQGMEKAAWSRN